MRVALFTTCLAEALAPRSLQATVLVLEHFGIAVDVPAEQTCCGQPLLSNGLPDDAAALARRMCVIFDAFDAVVTPSGSCCAVVRERFAELFVHGSDDHREALALAAKTFELVEFLETQLRVAVPTAAPSLASTRAPTSGACDASMTCHDACHLRGIHRHGCTAPFLAAFGCHDVRPLPDMAQCCGFGGMFSTQFPEVSVALGQEKLAHVASTGARTLVVSDTGCSAHLAGLAHRQRANNGDSNAPELRIISPAEALAHQLGLLAMEPSA